MAPICRKGSGSITAETAWLHDAENAVASIRRKVTTPTQLLLDVALGIALRRPETAHQAATAVLAAGGTDEPALSVPMEAAARTLAHLALGGMSMAELRGTLLPLLPLLLDLSGLEA